MRDAQRINLSINDRPVSVTTDSQRSILEVLREDLGLTGTKYGCGEGACGACTVLLDGKPIFSCTTAIAEAEGKSLITIEGLARGDALHPVQEAFLAVEAFQCGYCTPGMIVATVGLLQRKPNPSDEELRDALNGHLCRCCGYLRIQEALKRAVQRVHK
jgi:aerobic-type carbon monoxide dehydrogenase small subunit (CoxS/CutS family)